MARKSIGDLHSKVTADAQQFVNEFKRADNESRRSSAAIDKEVGALVKNVKKKFSASDIGKDLLRGFGVGSGFAAAQQAADMIVSYWEKAAEHAKSVEDSTARQLAAVQKMIALNQTDEQRLATKRKEEAQLQAEAAALAHQTERRVTYTAGAGYGSLGSSTVTEVPRALTGKEEADLQKKIAELAEKSAEVMELAKKIADESSAAATKSSEKAVDARLRTLREISKAEEDNFDKLISDQREKNEAYAAEQKSLEALAEKYRQIADPARVYNQQLAEADKLHSAGKLTAEQYAAAIREITYAKEKDQAQRVDDKLKDFFGPIDDMQRVEEKMTAFQSSMNQMWENVADRAASTFAQMVIDGEASFGDLSRLVAQTMIEITARMALINPLMNYAFNLGGAAIMPGFYGRGAAANVGAPHAVGGAVGAGMIYPVNEQGPELLTVGNRDYLMTGSQGGTVTPSNRLGGQGGASYHFHYTIPDAVTRAQLLPMLKATEQHTIAKMRELNLRGKN